MKVHVTSVGECARKTFHAVKGAPRIPHFYGVKGSITHKVIELSLTGEEIISVEYPSLVSDRADAASIPKDLYDASLEEAKRCIDNYVKWASETKLPAHNMISEETQEFQYRGQVITATPDLFDREHLVDFKTGKPIKRKEYLEQLGAYDWILRSSDKVGPQESMEYNIIFLGEEAPVEMPISKTVVESAGKDWRVKLDRHIDLIELIEKGGKPQCESGFHCCYCAYRGICMGV